MLTHGTVLRPTDIIGAHAQLTTFPATPNVTRTSAIGRASISLYIPGFDPQPVSADVVGVDGNGRTTWVLHRGSVDATDTRSYDAFGGSGESVVFVLSAAAICSFFFSGDWAQHCTFHIEEC